MMCVCMLRLVNKKNSNDGYVMNYKKIARCCVKALFLFKTIYFILLELFNTTSTKSRSYNMTTKANLLLTSRTVHKHNY
jgi:hypothetical protein